MDGVSLPRQPSNLVHPSGDLSEHVSTRKGGHHPPAKSSAEENLYGERDEMNNEIGMGGGGRSIERDVNSGGRNAEVVMEQVAGEVTANMDGGLGVGEDGKIAGDLGSGCTPTPNIPTAKDVDWASHPRAEADYPTLPYPSFPPAAPVPTPSPGTNAAYAHWPGLPPASHPSVKKNASKGNDKFDHGEKWNEGASSPLTELGSVQGDMSMPLRSSGAEEGDSTPGDGDANGIKATGDMRLGKTISGMAGGDGSGGTGKGPKKKKTTSAASAVSTSAAVTAPTQTNSAASRSTSKGKRKAKSPPPADSPAKKAGNPRKLAPATSTSPVSATAVTSTPAAPSSTSNWNGWNALIGHPSSGTGQHNTADHTATTTPQADEDLPDYIKNILYGNGNTQSVSDESRNYAAELKMLVEGNLPAVMDGTKVPTRANGDCEDSLTGSGSGAGGLRLGGQSGCDQQGTGMLDNLATYIPEPSQPQSEVKGRINSDRSTQATPRKANGEHQRRPSSSGPSATRTPGSHDDGNSLKTRAVSQSSSHTAPPATSATNGHNGVIPTPASRHGPPTAGTTSTTPLLDPVQARQAEQARIWSSDEAFEMQLLEKNWWPQAKGDIPLVLEGEYCCFGGKYRNVRQIVVKERFSVTLNLKESRVTDEGMKDVEGAPEFFLRIRDALHTDMDYKQANKLLATAGMSEHLSKVHGHPEEVVWGRYNPACPKDSPIQTLKYFGTSGRDIWYGMKLDWGVDVERYFRQLRQFVPAEKATEELDRDFIRFASDSFALSDKLFANGYNNRALTMSDLVYDPVAGRFVLLNHSATLPFEARTRKTATVASMSENTIGLLGWKAWRRQSDQVHALFLQRRAQVPSKQYEPLRDYQLSATRELEKVLLPYAEAGFTRLDGWHTNCRILEQLAAFLRGELLPASVAGTAPWGPAMQEGHHARRTMESIRERYIQYDFLHFTSTRPEVLMRYCNSFADAIKDLQRKTSDCDSPISIAKRMALYDLPTGSPVMSAMYGEIAKATLRLKLGCSEALFGTASGAFIRHVSVARKTDLPLFGNSSIVRIGSRGDLPSTDITSVWYMGWEAKTGRSLGMYSQAPESRTATSLLSAPDDISKTPHQCGHCAEVFATKDLMLHHIQHRDRSKISDCFAEMLAVYQARWSHTMLVARECMPFWLLSPNGARLAA